MLYPLKGKSAALVPVIAGQNGSQARVLMCVQLPCRNALEAKLAQGVKESAAAQEALESQGRDLVGISKEKAALSSEHDSLKDMLEALRGERAKLAEALDASEAKLAATEAQRTEQAERAEQLQQELAAAVTGREATEQKLVELESELLGATLQHRNLSKQHESAQQGSRDLETQLSSAQAAHEELSNKHDDAQNTMKSLREKVADLSKENEHLAKEASSKDAKLKEAVEAADRAQEEAEAQVTEAARKAAEEGEAQQFRIKNLETELRSSKTHIQELEALLKAAEASESVLKAKLAESHSKVITWTLLAVHSIPLCPTVPMFAGSVASVVTSGDVQSPDCQSSEQKATRCLGLMSGDDCV